jgi:hypothetical protein
MKSLGDAIHLRNWLIDLLEEADFDHTRPIALSVKAPKKVVGMVL